MPEKIKPIADDTKFMLCPFHGRVKAIEDGKDLFTCEIRDCEINRALKELES